MSPPPSRSSPRIEVYAQAEVQGRAIHIMSVRNLSAGGVYLEGTPDEYPELQPGTTLDLVIVGVEEGHGDDPDFHIACKAKVIRIDEGFPGKRPPGFGVTIEPVDGDNRDRLNTLLARATSFRAGASVPRG